MFIPLNLTANITSAGVATDLDGSYVVEIMPGEYNISALAVNLTGNNYNYTFNDVITITEEDIITGVTKDIVLVKEEE